MGKIAFSILISTAIISIMSCSSPDEKLVLHDSAILLKEPGLHNLDESNMRVSLLAKGSTLIVLDKEYGKDYLAYKVKTTDGHVGYIHHSNEMTLSNY